MPPLGSDDAVALFSARARAVNPAFELGETTTPIVESICVELDRLPLAIELAAARSKVLSPAELHSRLGSRLELLTRGPSDQPERLRSMHATISWSYDALPAEVAERLPTVVDVLGRLEPGSARRRCASRRPFPLLDGLAILLDHHLVQRDDSGSETRFGMFETVREFGQQELANAGDAYDVARRHATYFLAFAHTAEREFHKADQAAWLDRVATEHDNIRAALQWALAEDPEMALDLAGTLWRFWVLRGYVKEGLGWLERTIGAAGDAPSTVRARAMLGAGSMYEAIGDDEAAELRYLAGLRDWEALDDRDGHRPRLPPPRQRRSRARPVHRRRSSGTRRPFVSVSSSTTTSWSPVRCRTSAASPTSRGTTSERRSTGPGRRRSSARRATPTAWRRSSTTWPSWRRCEVIRPSP